MQLLDLVALWAGEDRAVPKQHEDVDVVRQHQQAQSSEAQVERQGNVSHMATPPSVSRGTTSWVSGSNHEGLAAAHASEQEVALIQARAGGVDYEVHLA